jgi:transposase-like protein
MPVKKTKGKVQVDTLETNNRQLTKEVVIEAIKESYGIVSVIAKKLGCERKTVYRWLEKNEEVKAAFISERETIIDLGEVKLVKRINEGSESMIALVLKTLGKDRGYVEGRLKSLDDDKINKLKELFDGI